MEYTITPKEFEQFRALIYRESGISLNDNKQVLLVSRLSKRLRTLQLDSFQAYYDLIAGQKDGDEFTMLLDLVSTNKTDFFREPKHFDFLRDQILGNHRPDHPFRVWSAASSTGEEPYSIAMTLAERLGEGYWDVLGSDLSSRALDRARVGHYSMNRAKDIPKQLLAKYCLKGIESQEGTFLIDQNLKSRVNFMQINLNFPLPKIGEFDVIFIRNVMIYFDAPTKKQVMDRIVSCLRRQGHLIIGHSESLNGVCEKLRVVRPSIYRKP